MSMFSKLGLRRVVGAGALAAAAVVGVTMGTGDAAALPNGYKKAVGIDGEVIQTWRTGESGLPAPTVANNPANRAAILSGTYTTKMSKGVNGNIAVKVLVGCQVNIEGLKGDLGGELSLGGTGSLSAGLSLPLSPGEVKVVKVTDKDVKKGVGAIQLSQFDISVKGCGGYASARSIVKVIGAKGFNTDDGTVNGEGTLIQSTLYGKPFSLN